MSDLDPWSITRASPKELLTNIETKSDRKIIRIWNMAVSLLLNLQQS